MPTPRRPPLPHRLTLAWYASAEEREAARAELVAAIRAADGRVDRVCAALDLTRPQYSRIVARYGLGDLAAELRVAAGVPGPRTSQLGAEHASPHAGAKGRKPRRRTSAG